MMVGRSNRLFLFAFLLSLFALASGFFVEYVMMIAPCSLCWLQRFAYMWVGFIGFAALWTPFSRSLRILYALVGMLGSVSGLVFAGRQVWLQNLAHGEVTACIPGIRILYQHMSLFRVLKIVLDGSSDCAVKHVPILGFDMAVWSVACFALLFLTMLYALIRR